MNIARISIENPLLTWIIILGCALGGLWGFTSLGQLEDPSFTIKTAVVVTSYPGASAAQVASEVTEPLESAIQKIGEVDLITSVNRPGLSQINVDIKPTVGSEELPGVWTRLRARISDNASQLPAEAGTPFVNDSFGDVFGIYYAITADGFSDAERYELARFLRRELLTVEGVADIEVSGLRDEAIFVEPNLSLSVNQNFPPTALVGAISTANSVGAVGRIMGPDSKISIQAPDGSDSEADIANLSVGVNGQVINLHDFATVSRGRQDDPDLLVRFNGTEALTLGIAGLQDENIVEVGKNIDAKLAELTADIPYGVELHPIYQQHLVVEEASNAFLVNLGMSVLIVVFVLALFMGWRAAIVVGSTLLLTVIGTLFFMALFSIEMERISLGALIIAMGMLVDNAIVVAEGMQISMRQGKSSLQAADDAASKTQIPLLGATIIGIMAFAGIGLSPDSTGEFLFSLFAVIGISLLLSWVLALTVTPLMGHYFFKVGAEGAGDAYNGALFRAYATTLRGALKARWLVVASLIVITVMCFAGFAQVKQQFFPNSNTPLFFVHYKLPQGTSIERTSRDLKDVEDWLLKREDVVSVATFVGQGATRFLLTYSAEKPNPSYGHLIIRTGTIEDIPTLQEDLEAFGRSAFPEAEFRTKRLVFGPGGSDPIEVRFSGPDPVVLRQLANEAMLRLDAATDDLIDLRSNWREQELVIKPEYSTDRGQMAGINRDDVANILQFATSGTQAGYYRENERQIPIIVRQDRDSGTGLNDQVVYSSITNSFVPIDQIIDGFGHEVQNTLIHRRDRVPTVTVGGDIPVDMTPAEVHGQVRATIEEMPLPEGYKMEWGGDFEASGDAQESLGRQLPISLIIMVLVSVLLFNAIRQPVIIWLLVPMSVNGVVLGLLGTGLPFTFTALLGLLSLSGMLIKNGIVLVEEIDIVRAGGVPLKEAIVTACTSRLRPVMLAAATTILGMAPLLSDAFFVSMAVTIMGGLAFASVLTLVAAPVFYYLFFARDETALATA